MTVNECFRKFCPPLLSVEICINFTTIPEDLKITREATMLLRWVSLDRGRGSRQVLLALQRKRQCRLPA